MCGGRQVTGPAGGKSSGCETGDTHPCWAAQQACLSCAPVLPPHTFVELGKAQTFDACMKVADEGWEDNGKVVHVIDDGWAEFRKSDKVRGLQVVFRVKCSHKPRCNSSPVSSATHFLPYSNATSRRS